MTANGFIRAYTIGFFVWFLSGFFLFPHAPLKECEQPSQSTYCGKRGVPYTEAQYQRFRVWEGGLITGFVLLIPLLFWQRRLAVRGDKDAIADVKRSNALSYRSLWAVRWLTATLVALQLVFGLVGATLLADQRGFVGFWLGGVLASGPGYLLGLAIQHRVNPSALRENKATAWILGVIVATLFVVATKILVEGGYAG